MWKRNNEGKKCLVFINNCFNQYCILLNKLIYLKMKNKFKKESSKEH